MNNEQISNGIRELQNIKMTLGEKDVMLGNILNYQAPLETEELPKAPIKSPYHSFFGISARLMPFYVTAFCLVIILGGGGMYVAQLQKENNRLALQIKENQIALNNQINALNPQENTINNNVDGSQVAQTNTGNGSNPSGIIAMGPKNISGSVKNTTTPSSGSSSETTPNPETSSIPSTGQVASIPTGSGVMPVGGAGSSPSRTTSKANLDRGTTSYIDTAYDLYGEWLNMTAGERKDILDYRINNVTFIAKKADATDQQMDWFTRSETKNAFIVKIIYSVQTTPAGMNYWLAGNGQESEDNWVLNKTTFVTIDMDPDDGTYYIVREGTGL